MPNPGAPVYGLVETYLGFGMVAGFAESYAERGRLIAELIREALAGGLPAPGRAMLTSPSRCVADARELQRWSLDERRLPDGCEILFANHSYWREHWWQILTALAIIVGQSLLIATHVRPAPEESRSRGRVRGSAFRRWRT